MSAQSGFLNCFLKFIQGEKGEKLPSLGRGKSVSRFTITVEERKAILTASSKRLNQGQKESEPKVEKDKRRVGRPRLHTTKPASRSTRSKGSTSEGESQSEQMDESMSKSESEERLCAKVDAANGDECVSDVQKQEEADDGDEGSSSGRVDAQSDDSSGESGKLLQDGRKSSGKNIESNKKRVSFSNSDKAESTANGSSVILNNEGNNSGDKKADLSSVDSSSVTEKKKRGRKRKIDSGEDGTPLRKLSSRKAKQKARISYAESGDEEDIPGLDDNSDSDDPVWVPDEKRGSSDEGSNFSWSKYEKLHLKSKKSSSISPVVTQSKSREKMEPCEVKGVKQYPTGSLVKENSGSGVGSSRNAKDSSSGEKSAIISKLTPTTLATNSKVTPTAMTADSSHTRAKDNAKILIPTTNSTTKSYAVEKNDLLNPSMTVMPFQSGTFIAQKSDLEEKEEPPIWRVDGKSLLQKYEPFRTENGSIWYRNVSTYSGWGPKSNMKYQEVPVKFIKQNRVETIVEIIQAELKINEEKLCEKLMKESEKYAYAYEVYVQTLVSQALDSNFLSEIISEKDEYFLNCLNEMDKVCAEKKAKLLNACQWPKKLKESITTWPIMTVSSSEPLSKNICSVCYTSKHVTEVKMDGNPYKCTTLEYEPPSQESFKSKEFIACLYCTETLTLFHKIAHLKYHTYERGVRMVSEMKALDPNKNNTDILHDILADTSIKKEFQEISSMWAQADMKSRMLKTSGEKKIIPMK